MKHFREFYEQHKILMNRYEKYLKVILFIEVYFVGVKCNFKNERRKKNYFLSLNQSYIRSASMRLEYMRTFAGTI